MAGPSYPPPDEPIDIDTFLTRWPNCYKVELMDGALWFEGQMGVWDERDIALAQQTFPGRIIWLHEEGHILVVEPSDPEWQREHESQRQRLEEQYREARRKGDVARPDEYEPEEWLRATQADDDIDSQCEVTHLEVLLAQVAEALRLELDHAQAPHRPRPQRGAAALRERPLRDRDALAQRNELDMLRMTIKSHHFDTEHLMSKIPDWKPRAADMFLYKAAGLEPPRAAGTDR